MIRENPLNHSRRSLKVQRNAISLGIAAAVALLIVLWMFNFFQGY